MLGLAWVSAYLVPGTTLQKFKGRVDIYMGIYVDTYPGGPYISRENGALYCTFYGSVIQLYLL